MGRFAKETVVAHLLMLLVGVNFGCYNVLLGSTFNFTVANGSHHGPNASAHPAFWEARASPGPGPAAGASWAHRRSPADITCTI